MSISRKLPNYVLTLS